MLQCPQCTKPLRELVRRCPTCQADLDLLVDYVSHLQGGLDRAENLVRAGELGQAVWAYLEVLEVDPDNATARRQVSQVVTAVRRAEQVAVDGITDRQDDAGIQRQHRRDQVADDGLGRAVAEAADEPPRQTGAEQHAQPDQRQSQRWSESPTTS